VFANPVSLAGIKPRFPLNESSFSLDARQSFDLRADFVNLTNTPILNAPDRAIGTTLVLLESSPGARNIQFVLKYF
jgi:hypothetical protein